MCHCIGTARHDFTDDNAFGRTVACNKNDKMPLFDETIARFYDKEQKTAQITHIAMAVAIFISCMGLFGLVMFTTARRTKEIGIRKVLGASAAGITVMICKDFIVLVVLSLLIASPVAWICMHRCLDNFPYQIAISGWIFLLAGIAAVAIALATVSFQAIRAAIVNPVNSLKTE